MSLFGPTSKDYDDKFKWYEKWTKAHIQPRIDDFMKFGKGNGLKYFDCDLKIDAYGSTEYRDHCLNIHSKLDEMHSWTLRYDLVDKKGFFDALAVETGIDESWITFGNVDESSCALPGIEHLPPGHVPPCRPVHWKKTQYPIKLADKDIHVGNPKKLIEASAANVTALSNSLFSSWMNVGLSFYDDGPRDSSPTDAVVAYSMPVLQIIEAIESMKRIKEIGAEAKKEARKQLIMEILGIIFMVIPFVGEGLGPLIGSVETIARIALLVGEAGNAALTVAEIVEDPESAPFAILGLIAGVGGGTGRVSKGEAMAQASKARGLVKAEDLAKFPKQFREKDALIQKVVTSLCAKK